MGSSGLATSERLKARRSQVPDGGFARGPLGRQVREMRPNDVGVFGSNQGRQNRSAAILMEQPVDRQDREVLP